MIPELQVVQLQPQDLSRISDLLDEGKKPEAIRLANQLGLRCLGGNFERIIAGQLQAAIPASNNEAGSTQAGQLGVTRYKDQMTRAEPEPIDAICAAIKTELQKQHKESGSNEDLISWSNNQCIQGDFSRNKGKRSESYITAAQLFITKDRQPPLILELSVEKKLSASKAHLINFDNYNMQIRILNFKTGAVLFKGSVDPRFDPRTLQSGTPDNAAYGFSSNSIALKLQSIKTLDTAKFELKTPITTLEERFKRRVENTPGAKPDDTRPTSADVILDIEFSSNNVNVFPSLQEFHGEQIRSVLQGLDFATDLRRLRDSGDIDTLLATAHLEQSVRESSSDDFYLSDRTKIFEQHDASQSVKHTNAGFRGASRR